MTTGLQQIVALAAIMKNLGALGVPVKAECVVRWADQLDALAHCIESATTRAEGEAEGLDRIAGMEFFLHENPDSDAESDTVRLVMALSEGNKVYCHRATQGDNGICRDDTTPTERTTQRGGEGPDYPDGCDHEGFPRSQS